MMKFIKDHRRFVLAMVILVALMALLGLKVVQQRVQIDELQDNIIALEAEYEVKKAEKNAAIEAMNAAKDASKTAKKALSDAKKVVSALEKDLKAAKSDLQQSDAVQAEGQAALNAVLDMLAAETVDQQELQAALETAVTALGGTMPGAEGEGTEK